MSKLREYFTAEAPGSNPAYTAAVHFILGALESSQEIVPKVIVEDKGGVLSIEDTKFLIEVQSEVLKLKTFIEGML